MHSKSWPVIGICLLAVAIVHVAPALAGTKSAPQCVFEAEVLRSKHRALLFGQEDVRAAMEVADEAKRCASSKYHGAVVAELHGLIGYFLYRSTRDEAYAKDAERLYLLGLQLDTEHNDILRYRIGQLLKEAKQYTRATEYVNQLLKNKSKGEGEYLSLALEIAVETNNWGQAKELVDILYNNYRNYFLNIPALSATVRTLCHYERKDVAVKFIDAVEKHRTAFSTYEANLLSATKAEANSQDCSTSERRKEGEGTKK